MKDVKYHVEITDMDTGEILYQKHLCGTLCYDGFKGLTDVFRRVRQSVDDGTPVALSVHFVPQSYLIKKNDTQLNIF